jgi:hypothetical protein
MCLAFQNVLNSKPKTGSMNLILIGTDHRLQSSVVKIHGQQKWVPRTGGKHFIDLVAHCVEKLGAKAILEEAHEDQEKTAPTLCSTFAKQKGIPWICMGLGEPGFADVLFDRPEEAIQSGRLPGILAGRYVIKTHRVREAFMRTEITKALDLYECVLAVVGYVHLGVLAQRFDVDKVDVEALLFTSPLTVDEGLS